MGDLAIRVENLGKMYRIGARQKRLNTLRERIQHLAASPFDYLLGTLRSPSEEEILWALRDVSFEAKQGEVLGILGRNGAGKTTLLKVLSRITEPTEGQADVYGRMGSLLEVGTGFHPELTGRENVYLNGTILGMNKAEVDRKFDEIVDFSGVERFIDTPIKRYSSGMKVRLGFAVAAHLEPEILLVDEVLAVGDAEFQKKCLGKMGDVAREGRTVLFVSHNMIALQSLCSRAIWLHDGQIQMDGEVAQVVSVYLQSFASVLTEQVWDNIETAPGNDLVRLHRVQVMPEDGSPTDPIKMQTPISIVVEYWNLAPDIQLHITLHLYTEQDIVAFTTASSIDLVWRNRPLPVGLFRSTCHIPGNLLNSGQHRILLLIIKDQSSVKDQSSLIYKHEDALSFDVMDTGMDRGAWYGKEPGVVRPRMRWITEHIESMQSGENLIRKATL